MSSFTYDSIIPIIISNYLNTIIIMAINQLLHEHIHTQNSPHYHDHQLQLHGCRGRSQHCCDLPLQHNVVLSCCTVGRHNTNDQTTLTTFIIYNNVNNNNNNNNNDNNNNNNNSIYDKLTIHYYGFTDYITNTHSNNIV